VRREDPYDGVHGLLVADRLRGLGVAGSGFGLSLALDLVHDREQLQVGMEHLLSIE
jgi:hypothetical protein